MTEPLTIDVVSDVVCPWCYVGKRRLERALSQRLDEQVDVHWLPFFLDPSVPPGGIPRIDYITRKFGTSGKITSAHERLVGIGASVGIDFKFDRIERQPNTLDAHRVIGWAQEAGVASPVVNRLFELFFTEGADIGRKICRTRCERTATGSRGRPRRRSRRASGHSRNERRDWRRSLFRLRQEAGGRRRARG
jgi:predicted DsbA family dithiol-disulfide isomerase